MNVGGGYEKVVFFDRDFGDSLSMTLNSSIRILQENGAVKVCL